MFFKKSFITLLVIVSKKKTLTHFTKGAQKNMVFGPRKTCSFSLFFCYKWDTNRRGRATPATTYPKCACNSSSFVQQVAVVVPPPFRFDNFKLKCDVSTFIFARKKGSFQKLRFDICITDYALSTQNFCVESSVFEKTIHWINFWKILYFYWFPKKVSRKRVEISKFFRALFCS